MKYAETLEYLEGLGKFGIHLGMERIEALLTHLGHPEQKIKTVHITGTNGKGSVSAMITNILLCSGLKVGTFTSPHFVKYNERIQLNGQDISDEAFATTCTAVAGAVDFVKEQGMDQPTQFEVLTAAAFLYFALEQVDYAVIEVGLGGLWDSTNVITPVVSVITNVTLEHTDRLGKTVEDIAMQKAGIIKDNVPVVTAATGEALGPIKAMSLFKQAPLYIYGQAFSAQEVLSSMQGQTFTLSSGYYNSNYDILLPGEHQLSNTAVAVVAAKIMSKQDKRITELALHQGVAHTKWPGRLELIAQRPDVILDGAHNPSGATALRRALDKYYPGQAIHFVFGMMADKNMQQVSEILFKTGDVVYTVRADAGARAASAEQLAGIVGPQATSYAVLSDAYESACREAGSAGIVCVCGSLYLIGSFKTWQQRSNYGKE